ncbi:LOW QUALITY PROTEIN: kremen protein 1 [Monodelphis domestica]|uniref:LOW QUALITY PROTEIN: kremen protein 1 n=1 Tax=Monodelphis domestica TaxID=13616 RepID=UPI0024E1BD65|nr:LOW QUALITY PROTEIN: kremen protein 1 [Monodelphis domestica]
MAPPAARLALLSAALALAARPGPGPGEAPECFTANGVDYRGRQNWTAPHGGKACLFWNETFQHPYNTLKYPHGEGGLGDHNYCRNPDGDVSPWCYVAEHEDGVYWKFCEIPACQMPGNLGCYRDLGNPPPLTGTSKTSNKLTIQNCISFCRSQKFKFAGMESGYACFCGNNPDYWKYGETASTECNSICFGDHTQPCGGDGRIILFDTLIGACGGNYTAASSVIYSPDFPDNYATGRACYWTIRVAGAARILFNFTLFDIRDAADMVELLDGYSHRVLARFGGRHRPPPAFNVSLDFVILYFFSDRVNQAQGFAVLYQALQEEVPAGGPPRNQSLAEGITEQSNLSASAARASKVLYVITTSPSHPPRAVPGWTMYGLASLLILTVTAVPGQGPPARHLQSLLWEVRASPSGGAAAAGPRTTHVCVAGAQRMAAAGELRDCRQPARRGEIWSIFYEPATSVSIFKKKLRGQSQPDDRNPLVGD